MIKQVNNFSMWNHHSCLDHSHIVSSCLLNKTVYSFVGFSLFHKKTMNTLHMHTLLDMFIEHQCQFHCIKPNSSCTICVVPLHQHIVRVTVGMSVRCTSPAPLVLTSLLQIIFQNKNNKKTALNSIYPLFSVHKTQSFVNSLIQLNVVVFSLLFFMKYVY